MCQFPAGRFGTRRTADEAPRQIRGTTAHELQHMVNFGERMRVGADAETVWLFVDRSNAQGLGWAYLSALTRLLGRARGGGQQ